jgi:imidazolonepropionase-like amidohydrolase
MLTRARSLVASSLLLAACAHRAPPVSTGPAPSSSPASTAVVALRFGALIDGTGRVLKDALVVVTGDRITSVGPGTGAVPSGTQVLDMRRYTALPGLIDVHTHMTYYWDRSPGTNPWSQNGQWRTPVKVFLAQENARKTLEAGVTAVRDLGASDYADIAMRDLINRGAMVGPRMFVAGYGLSKLRNAPQPGSAPAWPRGRIANIAEIEGAVKAQVDAGADIIKMYGSTGSGADVTGNETFTFDEMKAAVDAAHKFGKRIAIHSYGPDGGRDAVRAGTESLEHAVDLDDATIADMAKRGTFYVPTIDHNRYYAEYRAEFNYTPAQAAALDAYRARNIETARRAFKAGVKFAMGSDAVFTMFGQNARELEWFVDIGMTPAQAIAAATTNGATMLGKPNELGAVAPNYFADIIAVEGDPLADIRLVTRDVKWVMKGGTVVVDRTTTKPGK